MLFSQSLYPHIKTSTPLILSNHHTLFPSFPWNECPSHHCFSCSVSNCQQLSNLRFPCLYPDTIFPPFLCQAPVSWLSSHSTILVPCWHLWPLFSAPSGKSSALPLTPHTLRVSAVLLGPGNHSLGSGARCFWGQAGTKWRGRWVEDCGKLSYLKVSAICAVELGGGVYRLRCSGFAHQPPHTLAARGCRQVMSPSEPLYPRVWEQGQSLHLLQGVVKVQLINRSQCESRWLGTC